jgi:hypothetical protein
MLDFFQKESAKVKDENAKMHREVRPPPRLPSFDYTDFHSRMIEMSQVCVFCSFQVAKLQREAAHLRQSADTAEATMKVLSQHAKALAQAHMKLQSSKEEADSTIKKSILKVTIFPFPICHKNSLLVKCFFVVR